MIYILGIITAVVVGLVLKLATDRLNTPLQITRNELLAGIAAVSLVVVPTTVWVGTHVAKGNNLKYHEFWNGYETEATEHVRTCTKDGPCSYTYSCDPYTEYYTVTVVDRAAYTDANGNYYPEVSHTETRSRTVYHDCPYVTKEYTYSIDDSFGDTHWIGGTRFAENPEKWRGDGYENRSIPNVPRGEPKFWLEAKGRIDRGENGAVNKRMDYDNYILASQETILTKYSSAIEKYKKAKLLPNLTTSVREPYLADKVYPVGVKINKKEWNELVGRFNAAFGSDLQGDLHVVIFDDKKITNPDEYTQALYAYWQGEKFGKDALSKNTLVVFLGTDGTTVNWAGALTGMPVGNTQLLQEIRSGLRGRALYAPNLLGPPKLNLNKNNKLESVTLPNGGVLAMMVWGENKFERVSMSGSDKNDNGTGFGYLANNVELTGTQKFVISFVSLLTSCLVWGILLLAGDGRNHAHNARLVRSRYL